MNNPESAKYNQLTSAEEAVIIHKGTERPFTGQYYNFRGVGTYVCRRCNAPLYRSTDKFDSHCGWPSFDDEIAEAVKRIPDSDGMRTEIVCSRCNAHLGHVFLGERLTQKNVRHCVNSISLHFIPAEGKKNPDDLETAIFAGGCFWGTQYHFQQLYGVVSTEVGYIGGQKDNPTYKEVCTGKTGHAEAVKILYQPDKIDYEKLTRLFFEIHDPTQLNRQGPDMGDQYRSAIFYVDDNQKQIAEKLIAVLKDKGYKVVTEVTKGTTFWKAEDYHQNYYENNGSRPYCHKYTKRF